MQPEETVPSAASPPGLVAGPPDQPSTQDCPEPAVAHSPLTIPHNLSRQYRMERAQRLLDDLGM